MSAAQLFAAESSPCQVHELTDDCPLEHHFLDIRGIRLHVVQAGPTAGPLVILLHGFPEFWYGWRKQIPFLASQGYRVWAPDQRGYNQSDKPTAVAAYNLDELAADVKGLIAASGRQRVFLVGHDWGGAVIWHFSSLHSELIDRQVIINVPHPQVWLRHIRSNPRQLLKSWYVFLFQLPWLPEAVIRRANWRSMVRGLQRTSRPGTFSEEDIAAYRRAWSQPGAIESMVNWYRAAVRNPPQSVQGVQIAAPTLLLWGVRDRFAGRELAQPSIDLCRHGALIFLEDATHWVQHEEPARINDEIARFFASV